jgi:hypothetical protein
MRDLLTQIGEMIAGRFDGPLAFRFVLQPLVAAILGVRAGIGDAREGRPAYGWRFVTGNGDSRELIRDGWHDIAKLYVAAVAIDVIYELIVYRWVYPLQSLFIAAVLAVPSYFLIRGLANRLSRRWVSGDAHGATSGPDAGEVHHD